MDKNYKRSNNTDIGLNINLSFRMNDFAK
jgi:hypothetical protein